MTEQEWLACTDPTLMLEHFKCGNAASMTVRKRRLFMCQCCRRISNRLDAQGLRWLDVAEKFADDGGRMGELLGLGQASEATAGVSRAAALSATRKADFATVRFAADQAVFAVTETFRDSKWIAEKQDQATILRHIIGNPFYPYPCARPLARHSRATGRRALQRRELRFCLT